MRRPLVLGAAVLAMLLGAAAHHERSAGETALKESKVLLALGKVHAATVSARRAAEAAAPGSPYANEGYAELEIIARAAEVEGRTGDAAFAWRAMRSASEASFPAGAAKGRVEEAEAGILRTAESPVAAGAIDAACAPDDVLRRQLAKNQPPSPWLPSILGWALLALLIGLARRSLRAPNEPSGESPV